MWSDVSLRQVRCIKISRCTHAHEKKNLAERVHVVTAVTTVALYFAVSRSPGLGPDQSHEKKS